MDMPDFRSTACTELLLALVLLKYQLAKKSHIVYISTPITSLCCSQRGQHKLGDRFTFKDTY